MIAAIRIGIPLGKFRVIGVDPFTHEDYVVKDCDSVEEAFKLVDEYNHQRSDPMDNAQYAYNDQGDYLRGNEHILNYEGRVVYDRP